MVSPGEWVMPGKALFRLVSREPLKMELAVPEAAVRAIVSGERVEIATVAYPGKTYGATVSRIGAEIGPTRSLSVEALIDPGSNLIPGMFAEARVTIGQTTRPILPQAAVARRGRTWHAFVVVDGALEERVVQLGPSPGEGKVSIARGVAGGERVVAAPTDDLVDGARVE
jgi:RND family efflux transporter MFP subunit